MDVQNDFCNGGSLAVAGADEVVAPLNSVISSFEAAGLPIFFTRDWHPRDHISFDGHGGTWPPHCVQGTKGAQFHPALRIPGASIVVSKGGRRDVEAYSGFQGTSLKTQLESLEVDETFIGGLATDYCVKGTALDARRGGFKVRLLADCVRSVETHLGDGEKALEEMRLAGVELTDSKSVVGQLAGAQHYRHHPGPESQS